MRHAMKATHFSSLRFLHTLAMGLCAFVLAGCAYAVQTQGTVVHNLPSSVSGRSFYVMSATEVAGQIEHNLYARDVALGLMAKGMIEAPETNADYLVKISFGIKNGQKITTRSSEKTKECITEIYCDMLKEAGQPLYTTEVNTQTTQLYKRSFSLFLIDRVATQRANNVPQSVYEAKLTSEGTSESFMEVSRCIIMAALKDFPGQSGRTLNDVSTYDCLR